MIFVFEIILFMLIVKSNYFVIGFGFILFVLFQYNQYVQYNQFVILYSFDDSSTVKQIVYGKKCQMLYLKLEISLTFRWWRLPP